MQASVPHRPRPRGDPRSRFELDLRRLSTLKETPTPGGSEGVDQLAGEAVSH
jgi:hypothetical protein